MNYTEMEAKVREATNNEPYASKGLYALARTTLTHSQLGCIFDIDAGDCKCNVQLVSTWEGTHLQSTLLIFHSQLLNEIMPMIYKRFTEKAADEWRQIYKVSPDGNLTGSRLTIR